MMKALYEDLGAAFKFASEQAFQLAKFTSEEKQYEEFEFQQLEYRMTRS